MVDKECLVGGHGTLHCYKNVQSVVKKKQDIARSNLKGNSIDYGLCENKFYLACMKYYSHKKMLHKALQWKKSSKFDFVCHDCLPLIEILWCLWCVWDEWFTNTNCSSHYYWMQQYIDDTQVLFDRICWWNLFNINLRWDNI